MKRCPVCGKAFYVQFPDKWQYKRANQFICSWRCIRLLDKGEMNMPKILTDEQKAFAVQLVISGTDPRPYLMSCGSNAPEKLWSYIKQTIREKDPETYQKLPATLKGLRPPEDADPVKYVKMTGPIRTETPEAHNVDIVEMPEAPKLAPLQFEGYTVCCIESKTFGRFYWDRDHNHLDWTTAEGEEVSFTPTGWKMFLEELPKVAAILGVKL